MKNPNISINSIWYADDDSDDRDLFAQATRQVLPNASIDLIINGKDLMVMLQSRKKPDILFLDLVMPLKDGYDCLKEIRQENRLSHLPVVVFSGLSQEYQISSAYSLGAHLFYPKPSNYNDFLKGLERLFQLDWKNPLNITAGHYINSKYATYDPLLY